MCRSAFAKCIGVHVCVCAQTFSVERSRREIAHVQCSLNFTIAVFRQSVSAGGGGSSRVTKDSGCE